ncbi:hypothetical protein AURDEDRAFT_160715 [Auricularia subglabra TFB-10046 SS5]|nr:hypothetical protein AURDEDRAFT_160715 [Auricularia subglabra TFB-10046 SS5]
MASAELPFELWLRIFNAFTLVELLPAMRVCSLWRRAAIQSDDYSHYIYLFSPSDGAVETFLLQLHRSGSRPSEVGVFVEPPCDAIQTRILPAIAQHFYRLGVLVLRCDARYGDQILDLMRRPAPVLRELGLMLKGEKTCTTAPALPIDVLQGAAPALSTVILRNVRLPDSGRPPAFSNVTSVTLMYALGQITVVDHLWHCFPALAHLTMMGTFIFAAAVCSDLQAWRNLQTLDMNLDDAFAMPLFVNAPIDGIPSVQVRFPSEALVELCLSHLSDSLHMGFGVDVNDGKCVGIDIGISEMHSGRVRVFTRPHDQWFSPSMHGAFPPASIAERIVSLTLSDYLWIIMLHVAPPFPSLRDLSIACGRFVRIVDMTIEVRHPICPNLVTGSPREK